MAQRVQIGGRSAPAGVDDQQQFRQRLNRAVIVPSLAMVVLVVIFLALIAQLLTSARWVEHTDQVIAQLNRAERLFVDRETGIRGFLITGAPNFLEPYDAGNAALPQVLGDLRQLVSDNPTQLERLAALDGEQQAWEQYAQEALALYQSGGDYRSLVRSEAGKRRMDASRAIFGQMLDTEIELRSQRTTTTEQLTLAIVASTLGLALLLGALLAWSTRRQLMSLAAQYGTVLEATARSAARLRALHQIDRAILARAPFADTVARAVQRLAPLLGAPKAVALLTLPGEAEQVQLVVASDDVQRRSVPEVLVGMPAVVGQHEPQLLGQEELGATTPLLAEPLAAASLQQALVAPLRSNGETCGLLALGLPRDAAIDDEVVTLVREVADQLTVAFQQEQLRREVERLLANAEHARTAAEEARTVLDTLIDAAPIGFALHDTTMRQRVTNERLAEINGLSREAHLGRTPEEIVPHLAPVIREVLQQVMDSGKPIVDIEITGETAATVGQQRTWLASYYPVQVPGGALLGVGTVVLEITERKQAELAAQRAATRLRALHAIDRAILAQRDPAQTAAAALAQMQQVVPFTRGFTLSQDEHGAIAVLAELGHGAPWPVLTRNQAADTPFGTQHRPLHIADLATTTEHTRFTDWARSAGLRSMVAAPLQADGQLSGALLVAAEAPMAFDDEHVAIVAEVADQLAIVFQQAQLREALQRYANELERRVAERTAALSAANTELEAFGYSVAHDLRAPIRAMQSFASALLEDYGAQFDDLGQEYAQRIVNAGERMEELINDLLAYSRLSRAELSFTRVALDDVVADALAQLDERIQTSGVTIHIAASLPKVRGHRTTLTQVLVNLVGNALTFVRPGVAPVLSIRGAETDGWVRLEVEDNGIGIAPEHQERIFRVFERLHSIDQYPGTGIGLAIVRKGVERMGGTVGVSSQPGAGSTFWICLPACEVGP